jgi:hypothetical protein
MKNRNMVVVIIVLMTILGLAAVLAAATAVVYTSYLKTPVAAQAIQDNKKELTGPPVGDIKFLGKDTLGNDWSISLPAYVEGAYMQTWTIVVLKDFPNEQGVVLMEFDCLNRQSRIRLAAVIKDNKVIDLSKTVTDWEPYATNTWFSENVVSPVCKGKSEYTEEDLF